MVKKKGVISKRPAAALIVVATLALLSVVLLLCWSRSDYSREVSDFHFLGSAATRMLQEDGGGVCTDNEGRKFIISYDEFKAYVYHELDHPLPLDIEEILNDRYETASGRLKDASTVLISAKPRNRPLGKVQLRVTSGGIVYHNQSDKGGRAFEFNETLNETLK